MADNDPNINKAAAKTFFAEVVRRYGNSPNVIYEIANEPNGGGVTWSGSIKPYAQEVIPVIRAGAPNSVVIVGTPTWSQDVDIAARDQLSFPNVMYTLHFYACSHGQSLRDKASTAMALGAAIFSTEWGTTEASGGGNVCTGEADAWLAFYKQNNISWANWTISNANETSAARLYFFSNSSTVTA